MVYHFNSMSREIKSVNWTRRKIILSSAALASISCAPATKKALDADVIVLGAGLSGLNAARLLKSEGANVIVLDASDRIGGRMYTLDGVPGRPEAGGQQIGQSYARIRSTASDLGINIISAPTNGSRGKTMALNGQMFDAKDWVSSPLNTFPEQFKKASPDSAIFFAAMQENPLEDEYAWREMSAEKDISAQNYLKKHGFDADSIRLCDIALNANSLDSYAMLNVWRSLMIFNADSFGGEVEGGAQRLPEAMGASLGAGAVRMNTLVQGIDVDAAGVDIHTSKGSLRASFVVNALPLPATRNIKINAPLSAQNAEAIASIPYTQIQQVHLTVENAFWEKDGLPIQMWTDTPIERVFPVQNADGETISLTCWINGTGTKPDISDQEWSDLAVKTMADLRGAKTTASKVVRWDKNQPLSGGAYMHWAPKQAAKLADTMSKPAGRLHFAGEHMSHLHTGMEGAMESGERAAFEILDAINS